MKEREDLQPKVAFAKAQEHHNNGRLAEAEPLYRAGLAKEPGNAVARSYLGYLQFQMQRDREALETLDLALAADPRRAEAHAWRGLVLLRLGRLEEAVAANTRAVELDPRHMGAHNNLGFLLTELHRYPEAIPHLRRAVELGYRKPEPFVLIGRASVRIGKLTQAEQAFRDALKLAPSFVDARIGLSNVLYDLGEHDAGLAEVRSAIEASSKALGARSNHVMKLLYHEGMTPEQVAEEHKAAGEAYFEAYGSAGPLFRPRSLDPQRKLRIGYISPDLRLHATAFFLEALFASHDKEAFEIHCYSNADQTDEMTERLKGLVQGWRDVSKLSYREAAASIAADEIDILMDCAGHTNGHRLDVLALKPAPLQGTWLGYPHGTGLPTVDFRWTDDIADPPGMTESHYRERLVRLPGGTFCYRAPPDAPPPAPGPLERGEGPVFGCFNNPQKIGPKVIRLWATIVNAVPGARLRLKARQFRDEGAAARYRARFVEAGLAADRIEIEGRVTFKEGFAEYATIDVALDPFPYHGTTSTCEALWMATPVVVLPGRACVSRVGPSLLARVGLDELVARDEDHYRDIAIGLIRDPARLSELRRTLRDRMARSTLCDGPRFARSAEASFRAEWRAFCEKNTKHEVGAEAPSTVVEIDLG